MYIQSLISLANKFFRSINLVVRLSLMSYDAIDRQKFVKPMVMIVLLTYFYL